MLDQLGSLWDYWSELWAAKLAEGTPPAAPTPAAAQVVRR